MALADRPVRKACVIGAGPNGLAAAVRLAQAGISVDVFEAEAQPGGGARTMELTLPGFRHDFGSAVHPLAIGSPFLRRLPLEQHGLEWIYSPHELAHPLDGGRAVVLDRDLDRTAEGLGFDGPRWRRWMAPMVRNWPDLIEEVTAPLSLLPRRPFLMARFGLSAVPPAAFTARRLFRQDPAKALFAGIAGHSFLSLDSWLSSAVGVMLGVAAHAVGWPQPKGGSQAIADALIGYLGTLGGSVRTSRQIDSLDEVGEYDVVLADVTPRQLLKLARGRLDARETADLEGYRYGAGVFKIDYALSDPIPWAAPDCAKSITVHIGGTFEEIAASEASVTSGTPAERPFVLLAQPSLFDSTRAPKGKHVAWAYCHVPNGSTFDMQSRIESQIERFAPGFRDCVLARSVLTPTRLESMDANLVGGDINGGAYDLGQFMARPTRRGYRTSRPGLYLCSSSTPPSGGVHGMCGFHAAELALRDR